MFFKNERPGDFQAILLALNNLNPVHALILEADKSVWVQEENFTYTITLKVFIVVAMPVVICMVRQGQISVQIQK